MNDLSPVEQSPMVPTDPMVTMIERVALNPSADIEKLERMLAMKERLDERNAKVSFADALSVARAEIPPIIKDATVDFASSKGRTHYQHETLAGIAKQIDPVLSRHGLSYRFRTNQTGSMVTVTCIISHRDGYSEETALSGAPDQSGNKNSFQAVGSAVTYLQRYTLKAALGLSAEVDDDAQGAAPRPGHSREPQASPREQSQGAANKRDPAAVTASLIAGIDKIATVADLDAGSSEGTKFAAAWQWLEDEHPEEAAKVKQAFDARKAALSDDFIPF